MKKSKWLDCQGNEFFPKQKGTPSLVKIEHKNTATLDSARSKKKSKVAVLQLLQTYKHHMDCREVPLRRNLPLDLLVSAYSFCQFFFTMQNAIASVKYLLRLTSMSVPLCARNVSIYKEGMSNIKKKAAVYTDCFDYVIITVCFPLAIQKASLYFIPCLLLVISM